MGQRLIIGCGYLGRRVAALWQAAGHDVRALTRSDTGATELRRLGIEPVRGDVTEPDSLAGLAGAETVLYAVGLDRGAGRTQREVYVDGLHNVLTRIAADTRTLIYISSTSVYGQTGGEWVDETSPCEPTAANGQVCLDAERLLNPDLAGSMRVCVLRLSGIYGPGRLIARVQQLRSGEPLGVNPDGWLNLVHVDDAARSVLAAERQGVAGATYLVSDDRPIPRREYYENVARLVGAPEPRFERPPGRDGEWESLNKRISNRRLRTELECELRFPTIAEGLPHALAESIVEGGGLA